MIEDTWPELLLSESNIYQRLFGRYRIINDLINIRPDIIYKAYRNIKR